MYILCLFILCQVFQPFLGGLAIQLYSTATATQSPVDATHVTFRRSCASARSASSKTAAIVLIGTEAFSMRFITCVFLGSALIDSHLSLVHCSHLSLTSLQRLLFNLPQVLGGQVRGQKRMGLEGSLGFLQSKHSFQFTMPPLESQQIRPLGRKTI